MEAISTLASGCPATGWCAGQVAWSGMLLGQFTRQAQEEVWATGPDTFTGSTALGLTARPVPGGYILSGRGPFVSGGNYAQWYYPGTFVKSEDQPPELRFFLVPRSEVTIAESWHTVAMRGTGSNTVVFDDVFVPEYRTVPGADLREGTGPGAAEHDNPIYRLPWASVVPLIYGSVMAGATRAAYEAAVAALGQKRNPAGKKIADSEVLQMEVGFTDAKIDTAELLIHKLADRADSGLAYTVVDRAAVARDCSYAVTLLLDALDTVVQLSGTSAFSETSFIQQAWRDVHFAAAHQALDRRMIGARWGRLELGVDDVTPPIFY